MFEHSRKCIHILLKHNIILFTAMNYPVSKYCKYSFPVAQIVEHGASKAKIMGSIPRESKSW